MTIRLSESKSASLSIAGTQARIRLISEGVGSSGLYPGDVLERDGAAAFPAGTQIFMDHIMESDTWERKGQHSIKDLVGVTLTDALYDPLEKALNADAKFFEQSAAFIAEAMEYIGLSVEASGTITEGIVEAISPSPLNAIAIVPRAGRDGKITALIESYRETHGKIITEGASAPVESGKDKGMTPEDIQKIAEALAAAVAPMFATLTESLKPAPVVDPAGDATADVATVAEALVASALPESARKRVYEAMKTPNADVALVIEAEKAYVAEIMEGAKSEDGGVLREAAKTDPNTFKIGAWS